MNNTGLTQERLQANFKEFDLIKGKKTGYYADTSENRKKGRVGQKYTKDPEEANRGKSKRSGREMKNNKMTSTEKKQSKDSDEGSNLTPTVRDRYFSIIKEIGNPSVNYKLKVTPENIDSYKKKLEILKTEISNPGFSEDNKKNRTIKTSAFKSTEEENVHTLKMINFVIHNLDLRKEKFQSAK